MTDWSTVSDRELQDEIARRQLENPASAELVATDVLLLEVRDRFEEVVICFYPSEQLKAHYRSRVLYRGKPDRLCYLLAATMHDLMMDDGMIHGKRDDHIGPDTII